MKIYFSVFTSSRNSRYFIETVAVNIKTPLNKNQKNLFSIGFMTTGNSPAGNLQSLASFKAFALPSYESQL